MLRVRELGNGYEFVLPGDANTIHLIDDTGAESWPTLTKQAVAERLADRIAAHLGKGIL